MKKKKNTRNKGNFYEEIALQYLLSNGFIFIKKNFYTPFGEIDLIMQKGNVLHFIEVKSSNRFNPLYNITEKKLEKLMKTIDIFMQNYDFSNIILDTNIDSKSNLDSNNTENKPHFCIDALSIYNNEVHFIENITM